MKYIIRYDGFKTQEVYDSYEEAEADLNWNYCEYDARICEIEDDKPHGETK